MKRYLLFLIITFLPLFTFATVTIFNQSGHVNSTIYGNNQNLGTFAPNAVILNGGSAESSQDGGDDVCSVFMDYSVSGGGPSGTIQLAYVSGSDNKSWSTTSSSVNISNLPDGNYTLSLSYYIEGKFGGVTCFGSGNEFTTGTLASRSLTFTISKVLPVEFSTFEVGNSVKENKLNWQTTLELNNSHFNIQRSPNGEAWKTIGMVKGAGTTDEPQSYTFMDEHPYPGINYYRLEQVDLDGTTDYSWVVSTEVKGDFTIIPNPSTESQMTQLFFSEAAPTGSTVSVLDVSGRVVFEQKINVDQSFLEISLPELASGIYFARLILPDGKTGAQGKIMKK